MGVYTATPLLERSTGLDQNMSARLLLLLLHLKPQELHGISLARPLELDIGKSEPSQHNPQRVHRDEVF